MRAYDLDAKFIGHWRLLTLFITSSLNSLKFLALSSFSGGLYLQKLNFPSPKLAKNNLRDLLTKAISNYVLNILFTQF